MNGHRDTIFSDRDRSDPSPSRWNEGSFSFLDRVSGQYGAQVRDVAEAWYREYPRQGRSDLRERLRENTQVGAAALLELFLHEMLRRGGFKMLPHPDLMDSPTTLISWCQAMVAHPI
ncbi:hypothetical protein [Kytococcus sp. Marseille-QA3725]